MKRWGKLAILGVAAALTAGAALARETRNLRTVELTSGAMLTGEVTAGDKYLEVRTADATWFLSRSEVVRIDDKPARAALAAPRVTRPAPAAREVVKRSPARVALPIPEALSPSQRRARSRARARRLINAFASPDTTIVDSAFQQMVSMRPFPTSSVNRALRDRRAQVRMVAARTIAAANDTRNAKALVNVAFTDPDDKVRRAAGRAIGQMRGPEALTGLIRRSAAARSETEIARAAEAIRAADRKVTVDALIGYATLVVRAVQMDNPTMTTIPIQTVQVLPTTPPVVVAVSLPVQLPSLQLTRVNTTVTLPVLEILTRATGRNPGGSAAAWKHWWKQNRTAFSFPG